MEKETRSYPLATHMVLAFTLLVLLSALAIGIPAVWLVRQEMDERAWSQIDQGYLAAEALLQVRQNEVRSMALLAAQRPTLKQLITAGETEAVNAYLEELIQESPVRAIAVCRMGTLLAGASPLGDPSPFCTAGLSGEFLLIPGDPDTEIWLVSRQPATLPDSARAEIAAAAPLDDAFAQELQERLGMALTFWVNDQAAASSLVSPPERRTVPDSESRLRFEQAGHLYYGRQFPIPGAGGFVEVSMDVSGIVENQNRMFVLLLAGIAGVALLGSAFGLLLANRISRPLRSLAEAASAIHPLDQGLPAPIQSNVAEVDRLYQALNRARLELQTTLSRLQREKDWSDHLLASIVEGVVTLDPYGAIQFFSHGAERITGMTRSEVLGKPISQVFRSEDWQTWLLDMNQDSLQAQKINVELPNGSQAALSVTRAHLTPALSGENETALVFRDITQEEVIHRLLGQFLANIAHEFRTPLSALAASTELLLDQAPDLSIEELDELHQSLHLSVVNLQGLIDNLLESASMEAGHFRVSPRPYKLEAIVEEARQTMAPLLEKYNQRLLTDLPPAETIVRADPRRIVQVLMNLLSNASKYGPPDAEIRLSAEMENGFVRIRVCDQGQGIPAEQRQTIFVRFAYPRAGTEPAKAGAGIGLSVVKGIVEAHGGQVGVEDGAGGGTVFWFTLPVRGDS